MDSWTAARLRCEINARAHAIARAQGLRHELSDAAEPSVIFGVDDAGRHGNFHPAAFRRLCAHPDWLARLNKVHTRSKRMHARSDWRWKELDCACSSDALLMNIFCHPQTMRSARVVALLGLDGHEQPVFGFKARVPLLRGLFDQTEVDMRLGDVLVEAKLTESGFQRATAAKLARYRDLSTVFGWCNDPVALGAWVAADASGGSYQVVRGILAAHASGCAFCLLTDARRPDLIETWYSVLREVRDAELRCRIMLLTWQELAGCLPRGMQQFLGAKYGIVTTGH